MKITRLLSLLFLSCVLLLTACEKVEYFKSEKTISKQIQGSWSLVPIPQSNPKEIWTFSNNVVYRSKQLNGGDIVPFDTASYTVNTYATKVVIEIENFRQVKEELNGDWQVVELTDDYLIFATDHHKSTGILQREFTRMN
jgi:hypothetical protein